MEAGGTSDSSASEAYFLEMEDDLTWKDNSLDAYSARICVPVTFQKKDGCVDGIRCTVITDNYGFFFQKHIGKSDPELGWDELITVDGEGSIHDEKLVFSFDPEAIRQAYLMGSVWGTDHLVWLLHQKTQDDKWTYHFWETDNDLQVVWDFYSDFLDENELEVPDIIMKDKDGYIHFIARYQMTTDGKYYVVDEKGKVMYVSPLNENGRNDYYNLGMTGDGRVYLHRHMDDKKGNLSEELIIKDWKDGEKKVIVTREINEDNLQQSFCVLDSETILYADMTGIYKCDYTWENKAPLYLWRNHGINPLAASVYSKYNGEIGVFLRDKEGDQFLVLTPTKELTEIREITLAVAPHREDQYAPIVANFNKKYPAYHVELVANYDKSRLLTELVSGKGPVLIDTCLTGFERQIKLWEPLDGMMEATGLKNELTEKALSLGRIDGVTYGIVSDYSISALITSDQNLEKEKWTYEYFLKRAESENLTSIFPTVEGNLSGNTLVFSYLMHGLDDNYLLDNINGQGNLIDSEKLRKILNLAKEKCDDEKSGMDWSAAFQKKEVLCVRCDIRDVSAIAHIREHYGDNVVYIGYPTKDGGKYFVEAPYPLCVRSTASEEDKKIAFTFLREMLSHDGQSAIINRSMDYGISVRKDIFEEQIQRSIDATIEMASWYGTEGLEELRKELERDAVFYRNLVEEAVPKNSLPAELEEIMWDEFTDYFTGKINGNALEDHLKNRIKLYLEETR